MQDIGRTTDGADWQKIARCEGTQRCVVLPVALAAELHEALDSIPPSKPRSLISTGWRRCYIKRPLQGEIARPDGRYLPSNNRSVNSLVLASRLSRVVVMVEAGRGRFPKFHQWTSASSLGMVLLLKTGNALMMVVLVDDPSTSIWPEPLLPPLLTTIAWVWGPGWRWESQRSAALHPRSSRCWTRRTRIKNRMVSSIGGDQGEFILIASCAVHRYANG